MKDKFKKFLNEFNIFKSDWKIINEIKKEADEEMSPGQGMWNMIPIQTGEKYKDALNRCIAFLEKVVETFDEFSEEEIEEIPKPQEEVKELIEEKPKKKTWEDLSDEDKEFIKKALEPLEGREFGRKKAAMTNKFKVKIPIMVDSLKGDKEIPKKEVNSQPKNKSERGIQIIE